MKQIDEQAELLLQKSSRRFPVWNTSVPPRFPVLSANFGRSNSRTMFKRILSAKFRARAAEDKSWSKFFSFPTRCQAPGRSSCIRLHRLPIGRHLFLFFPFSVASAASRANGRKRFARSRFHASVDSFVRVNEGSMIQKSIANRRTVTADRKWRGGTTDLRGVLIVSLLRWADCCAILFGYVWWLSVFRSCLRRASYFLFLIEGVGYAADG